MYTSSIKIVVLHHVFALQRVILCTKKSVCIMTADFINVHFTEIFQ